MIDDCCWERGGDQTRPPPTTNQSNSSSRRGAARLLLVLSSKQNSLVHRRWQFRSCVILLTASLQSPTKIQSFVNSIPLLSRIIQKTWNDVIIQQVQIGRARGRFSFLFFIFHLDSTLACCLLPSRGGGEKRSYPQKKHCLGTLGQVVKGMLVSFLPKISPTIYCVLFRRFSLIFRISHKS